MDSRESILATSDGDSHEYHPLQGVPQFLELPTPGELSPESRDVATNNGILALLGVYRTQCLFSSNWMLRSAVLQRVRLMLVDNSFTSTEEGIGELLNELLSIVQVGLEDEVDQVVVSASILAEHILTSLLR